MSNSSACLNARAALAHIPQLKERFDAAFEAALASREASHAMVANELRYSLMERMENFRNEHLFCVEAERTLDLKKQYQSQVDFLKENEMVQVKQEIDPASGREREYLYLRAVDNQEYPIPSYREILLRLAEKKDLIRIKADQGFTRLLLVPFGMGLNEMIENFKGFIWRVEQAAIDRISPIDTQHSFLTVADPHGSIVYHPDVFDGDRSGGRAKSEILADRESVSTSGAWDVLLLQVSETGKSFRDTAVNDDEEHGRTQKRRGIKPGLSPDEYLSALQKTQSDPASPYYGESGMTPEAWIMLVMAHIQITATPIDVGWAADACRTYLMGAYNRHSNGVFYTGWNENRHQLYVRYANTDNQDHDISARFVVRV